MQKIIMPFKGLRLSFIVAIHNTRSVWAKWLKKYNSMFIANVDCDILYNLRLDFIIWALNIDQISTITLVIISCIFLPSWHFTGWITTLKVHSICFTRDNTFICWIHPNSFSSYKRSHIWSQMLSYYSSRLCCHSYWKLSEFI